MTVQRQRHMGLRLSNLACCLCVSLLCAAPPDRSTCVGKPRPAAVPGVRQACTDLGGWTQAGQLPLVYSDTYNIRCFGLEKCVAS